MCAVICAADCKAVDRLVNSTTSTTATATTTTTTAAAAAGAVVTDDEDVMRLHISPRPNDRGQLVRAVGSSVVFTCQRVIAHVDGGDQSAAEATTIEWFDKNDMIIPSQTSHR